MTKSQLRMYLQVLDSAVERMNKNETEGTRFKSLIVELVASNGDSIRIDVGDPKK